MPRALFGVLFERLKGSLLSRSSGISREHFPDKLSRSGTPFSTMVASSRKTCQSAVVIRVRVGNLEPQHNRYVPGISLRRYTLHTPC